MAEPTTAAHGVHPALIDELLGAWVQVWLEFHVQYDGIYSRLDATLAIARLLDVFLDWQAQGLGLDAAAAARLRRGVLPLVAMVLGVPGEEQP